MGVFLGGSLFDNVVKMSVMERMNYGGIFGGISETVKWVVPLWHYPHIDFNASY